MKRSARNPRLLPKFTIFHVFEYQDTVKSILEKNTFLLKKSLSIIKEAISPNFQIRLLKRHGPETTQIYRTIWILRHATSEI